MTDSKQYRKHFIPLESNPIVFTDLIHKLGVSQSLAFSDVLSLDDQELLAFVPRPVYALVLVLPDSAAYAKHKAEEESGLVEYAGSGAGEDAVWFKQTINNACGLYAILHAVANGEAREYIAQDSTLGKILEDVIPLAPEGRALALEGSGELERAYAAAATQGDSVAPDNPEDEVDVHYICFVKSARSGHLYRMDGDSKGPVDLGPGVGQDEDLLSEGALGVVREYILREKNQNLRFSLMALGPNNDWDDY